MRIKSASRGGALLTVLWLTAALSAIAFALANNVRGETERTATSVENVKTHYLATAAIERALLYMDWGALLMADGSGPYYTRGTPFMRFQFPTGEGFVEIIPESSKININRATPEELHRLLTALGTEPARAGVIVEAIVDWRSPSPEGATPYDGFYLSLAPSFRSRHASFQEIEEVLLVRGMTPEIFYGSYARDEQGRLIRRGGLRDCISVVGASAQVDINTVQPAVLEAIGVSPDMAAVILERRRRMPFRAAEEITELGLGPLQNRLRIGGNSISTLRATARLRLPNGMLSDMRRSVAAMVKRGQQRADQPYYVLRWYDNVWTQ